MPLISEPFDNLYSLLLYVHASPYLFHKVQHYNPSETTAFQIKLQQQPGGFGARFKDSRGFSRLLLRFEVDGLLGSAA